MTKLVPLRTIEHGLRRALATLGERGSQQAIHDVLGIKRFMRDIVVPSRISHEPFEIIPGEGAEKLLPHAFAEVIGRHVNLGN